MTAPKHHLIITGTGRSGTTCLVQLFTELKLDTGFTSANEQIFTNCDAGMEQDLRQHNAPYIVKSPWICDYLDEVLASGQLAIDHAIIPVRDLHSAAESRRDVLRRTDPGLRNSAGEVPGGLWHTREPEKQEIVLTGQFYKLIYALAKYDVPLTLLYFPRFIHDPVYLYHKIPCVLGAVGYDLFLEAFQRVIQPRLIHDFSCSAKEATSLFVGKPAPPTAV